MRAEMRGRVARPAPAWWNVAKTLVQTACFWSVFLVILPLTEQRIEEAIGLARFRFSGIVPEIAGIALIACGSLLGLWSGLVMAVIGSGTPMPTDSTRALVAIGPYRRIRNPMVVAGSSQALGVSLLLGSPFLIIGVCIAMRIWNACVRPWEEADLEARFGEPYRRYRQAVPCWRIARHPYR